MVILAERWGEEGENCLRGKLVVLFYRGIWQIARLSYQPSSSLLVLPLLVEHPASPRYAEFAMKSKVIPRKRHSVP